MSEASESSVENTQTAVSQSLDSPPPASGNVLSEEDAAIAPALSHLRELIDEAGFDVDAILLAYKPIIESFIVNKSSPRLFVYAGDEGAVATSEITTELVNTRHLYYLIKTEPIALYGDEFSTKVISGDIIGEVLPNLLHSLQDTYIPILEKELEVPDALKTEFLCGAEHFLSALTDVVATADGSFVLYAPSIPDEMTAIQDRVLIQRMETVVFSWCR